MPLSSPASASKQATIPLYKNGLFIIILALSWIVPTSCRYTCAANASSLPPRDILRGAHLTIGELEWAPFAIQNQKTKQWSGMDIEILKTMAKSLGFTYTIRVIPAPDANSNLTWSQSLYNALGENGWADVAGTYWMHTPARRLEVDFALGHVDTSLYLFTSSPVPTAESVWTKMMTFMEPFDGLVWLCIFLSTIFAGMIFWVMEVGYGSTDLEEANNWFEGMGITTYLAFAVFAQTGNNPEPRTTGGRIYNIMFGLFILVLISCYTASMASFLTARTSFDSISSMSDLSSQGKAVCVDSSLQWQADLIRKFYPSVQIRPMLYSKIKDAVLDRDCAAGITDKAQFEGWKSGKDACPLVAVQMITQLQAGWATPLHSSCLLQAFNLVLQEMLFSGQLTELQNTWFSIAICNSGHRRDGSEDEVSRRKGAAGKSSAAAGAQGAGDRGTQLTLEDMGGVFLFFLFGSVAVLVCTGVKRYSMKQACVFSETMKPRDKEPEAAHQQLDKTGVEAEPLIALSAKMRQIEQKLDSVERIEQKLDSLAHIMQQLGLSSMPTSPIASGFPSSMPPAPAPAPWFPETMHAAQPAQLAQPTQFQPFDAVVAPAVLPKGRSDAIFEPFGTGTEGQRSQNDILRDIIAVEVTKAFRRYDFNDNNTLEEDEIGPFFTNVQFLCHSNPMLSAVTEKTVTATRNSLDAKFHMPGALPPDLDYCIRWWQDQLCPLR